MISLVTIIGHHYTSIDRRSHLITNEMRHQGWCDCIHHCANDPGGDGAGWQVVDPSLLQDNLCWFSYRIIGRNTANQAATCYNLIIV